MTVRLSFHDRTKQFHLSIPKEWPTIVKHVATVLFTFAGADDGGGIICSVKTLSEHAGENQRTVQRAQSFLRAGGFLIDEGEISPRPGIIIPARRLVLEAIADARQQGAGTDDSQPAVCDDASEWDVPEPASLRALDEPKTSPVTPRVSNGVSRGVSPVTPITESKKENINTPLRELSSEPSKGPTAREAFDAWNALTRGLLKQARVLDATRSRQINAVLETYFADSLESFSSYVRTIAGSPFLTGKNDRGWRADLEWALKPANIRKVLDGRYEGPAPGGDFAEVRTRL